MLTIRDFSNECRKAREEAGLTLVQAQMRINSLRTTSDKPICTEQSLIRWEKGRGLPKIEPVRAMEIVYDKPGLMDLRIRCIEFLKKRKTACAATQTAK